MTDLGECVWGECVWVSEYLLEQKNNNKGNNNNNKVDWAVELEHGLCLYII